MSEPRPTLDYAKPKPPRAPVAVRVTFDLLAIGLCGLGALLCGIGLVMALIFVVEFNWRNVATVISLLGLGAAVWSIGTRFDARTGSIRLR